MARRRYLGIDESNHGRYPEIYVGVLSRSLSDIKESRGLAKRRKKPVEILEFLGPREFKHLMIPKDYALLLGDQNRTTNIKVVAFSELIQSFGGRGLEVFVDGHERESLVEILERTIYPVKIKRIEFIEKGDTKIPLINYADNIANALFKYYNRCRGRNVTEGHGRYLDHLITFPIERYKDLAVH